MNTPETKQSIQCRGTGRNLTIAQAARLASPPTCATRIPLSKPSGLCHFCERTEAR